MKALTYAALLCAVLMGAVACDSPTQTGGPIIVISATWQNKVNPQHTIFFRSPDDGQQRGVLAGRENHPTYGNERMVGGFWADGRLEITIHRGEDKRHRYVAVVQQDRPRELQFTSPNGGEPFVLVQP